MSTVIDEKIVSMQFDNKQFEKNTAVTMNSLRQLESTACSAGFKIQDVWHKMSNFFEYNIARKIVTSATNIAKALTIEPVSTGLKEYETQLNAVQTILANTESKGTTLDDVNTALDTLNEYADKTIYNFTEMTRNIGTFTAAGVDLETSVSAIQGIANLAAVSGSTSQQASTAMYQLSQALSTGTVRLMDWNSVVNAGMGGEVFQTALKETARVHGVAIDEIIESRGSFRESLQDEWLTADILTETLEKMTMNTKYATKEEIAANREKLRTIGYTEEQIEGIFKLGNTAVGAATEVKTASQLFETLKESAQSGWAQTWEIIIGDFEDAKKLWTSVSNVVGGFIEKTSNIRNELLGGALNSGWDKLLSQGIFNESGFQNQIKKVAKTYKISFDEMAKEGESFEETLRRLMNEGKITTNMLSEGLDGLTNTYADYTDEQKKSEGITDAQIEKLQELNAKVQAGEISMEEFAASIKKLSGRELLIQSFANIFKYLGDFLKPIAPAFREIFGELKAEHLYNIIEKFHKFTSELKVSEETADKLKRVFKGVFALLDIGWKIIKSVFGALSKVTKLLPNLNGGTLDLLANLGDAIVKFRDFLDESNSFQIFSENVVKVFGAIVGAIKKFFSVITSPFKADGFEKFKNTLVGIWDVIKNIAGKIGGFFKKIGIAIKDAIVNNWSLENLEKVFDVLFTGLIGGGIAGIIFKFNDILKTFKKKVDLEGTFKEIGKKISEVFDEIKKPIQEFQNSIKAEALKKIAIAIAILVGSILVLTLIDQDKLVDAMTAIGVLFAALIGSLALINKMDFSGMELTKITGMIVGMATSMLIMSWALKSISKLSWDQVKTGLLGIGGCMAILLSTMALMKLISKMKGETLVGKMLGLVSMLLLLSLSLKILGTMSWDQVKSALTAMGGAFAILLSTMALMKLISKIDGKAKGANSMISLAIVLMILSGSLKMLGSMSWDEIKRGLFAMTGALVVLGGTVAALSAVAKIEKKSGRATKSVVKIAIMLGTFAATLKILASMSWDELKRGLVAMTGILVTLAGTLALLSLISKFQKGSQGAIAAIYEITVALLLTTASLKILATMSWDDIKRGLTAMGGALVGLTGTLAVLALIGKLQNGSRSGVGKVLVLTGALLVLSGVLKILGGMSWKEIGKSLVAMTASLAALVGAMAIMSKLGSGGSMLGGAAAMLIMVASINLLVPAIALLGNMKTGTIAKGLITIAAALAIFGVAGALLKPAIPGMLAAAAAIGIIGMACLAVGAGISMLSVGLSLLIKTLTSVTAEGAERIVMALKAIIEGIASMIPFVVQKLGEAIIAFCEVIIQGAPVLAEAIVTVLLAVIDILVTVIPELALGLLQIILGILDVLAEYAPQITESLFKLILGVINKIAEYAPELTKAFVNIFIKVFEGFAEAFKTADGDLLQEGFESIGLLTKMMLLLNAIALLLPGATVGVIGLGVIAGEMALVFAALGKLAQIKGLTELIGEGGGLLQAVGTAIGKFVGGIVGGVAEGVTSSLPAVGTNLSNFMTNLKPFLDGIALLDASVLENAKTLTQVILTITATSILDALTAWLTGGASVADFGEQIAAFGTGVKKFADETSGINPETITAAAKAGEALGKMAKNIPTSGGLWNLIAGKKDVGKFGDELAKFGPGLKKFDEETKGVNPDTVNEAAKAGKNLAEMAKKIPTSGGLWNLIAGEHDLEDFGDQLGKFGGGVKSFSDEIKGTDLAAVESGVTAGKAVAEMAKTLPTTGGLWQLIKGEEGDMDGFADGLVTFATGIKDFVTEIGDGSMVATACEYIKQFNRTLTEFATTSLDSIAQSVTNVDAQFINAITTMMSRGITTVMAHGPVYDHVGQYLMTSFSSGIIASSSSVTLAFGKVISETIRVVSNPIIYRAVQACGKNFATGFANGIMSNIGKVVGAAMAMANAANNAVRSILKIASPSKVAKENGEFYGGAFVDTVADFADKAYSAGSNMATEAVEGLKSASNIINQVLEEGVDAQPVITPVLNLNEIQSGVVSLNNMLGVKSSIGLSRANSISTTMMKIQNGGNDDVVSAIKDLRNSIDNMSGDTYQINGITVDSGNEISAAFETILRAAKIERRR